MVQNEKLIKFYSNGLYMTKQKITFYKSLRKFKKYDAYDADDKYICSFGDVRYQHYFDRIGLYSNLNHLDTSRKKLYFKRHNHSYNKYSPDWFSKFILWGSKTPLTILNG